MEFSQVKIVTFVPKENADDVREVLARAGAGQSDKYSKVSFSSEGRGRFLPNELASPHIGKAGVLEEVVEERIEVVCKRSKAKGLIDALIEAHPYEEVSYDVYPILRYSDL